MERTDLPVDAGSLWGGDSRAELCVTRVAAL
jgi:hypothetical protein